MNPGKIIIPPCVPYTIPNDVNMAGHVAMSPAREKPSHKFIQRAKLRPVSTAFQQLLIKLIYSAIFGLRGRTHLAADSGFTR